MLLLLRGRGFGLGILFNAQEFVISWNMARDGRRSTWRLLETPSILPAGSKHKMCTWVNEESWEMMENCFPDAKEIKNIQKLFYANNVHMFKNI